MRGERLEVGGLRLIVESWRLELRKRLDNQNANTDKQVKGRGATGIYIRF